jgi:hypothetical protein
MNSYSHNSDPLGHGQPEPTQRTVLARRVRQQTYRGKEADPVKKERNHERAQEYAIVAYVLRDVLQLGVCSGVVGEKSHLLNKKEKN